MSTRVLLIWRYFLVLTTAQICLSVLNSLFILNDHNAILALLALYSYLSINKRALVFFLGLEFLSLFTDVIRVALWTQTITTDYLGVVSVLGTYYLVMTVFGWAVKVLLSVFGVVLYRYLDVWVLTVSDLIRNWLVLVQLLEQDQYVSVVREEAGLSVPEPSNT